MVREDAVSWSAAILAAARAGRWRDAWRDARGPEGLERPDLVSEAMLYLVIKALISGAIVAAVSQIAKRYPGLGGLVASLPLVSVLGMMWLWRDTGDPVRMAAHSTGTFWFVLPSLPMFLLIPALLRRGIGFWPALAAGCLLTMGLYLATVMVGPKLGLKL